YLPAPPVQCLVHPSRAVLERHGIRKSGTTAADNSNPESGRQWILLRHDFLYFSNRVGGQCNRRCLGLNFGCCCRGHLSLLDSTTLDYNKHKYSSCEKRAAESLSTLLQSLSFRCP